MSSYRRGFDYGFADDNLDRVCAKFYKDSETVMWLVKMRFVASNEDDLLDCYESILDSEEFDRIVADYWAFVCWNNHGNECLPSEIDYRALMDEFIHNNGWMDELREEIRDNGDGWGIEELLADAEKLREELLQ